MNVTDYSATSLVISVSDIRDRFFDGEKLSEEEYIALRNFDRYRLDQLNKLQNSEQFDQCYYQLQILENLHPYQHFLDFDNISEAIK